MINRQITTDHYNLYPSQIVVYTTRSCPDCNRAKQFLERNNISYLPVMLEGDEEAARFVLRINNGYQSVPTIVFPDGFILVEPSWEELRARFLNS
jgi:mycoredoxin